METASRGRGPGKDRKKPPVLRWRVGSYNRAKKRRTIPLNDAAKLPCPNIARIRPTSEYCPLCKQWHRLLSSNRDELQILVNIGTVGLDPFRRKRPEDNDPFCQQIIHSSIIFGWKNLIPIETSPGVYPIITTFYDMIRARDSRYYSTLFGGMLHLHVMEKGAQALVSIPQLCLEMKSKTLQHLQAEIDKLVLEDRRADDFTLSTVYVMAQHELNPEALRLAPPLKYPRSPTAHYQLLGSVGLMKMEPSHFKALYHLVAQRGGIHAIKTFGVANQLATGDLVAATLSISPPRFDCLWTPKTIVEMGCDVDALSTQRLSATFGEQFTTLSDDSRTSITPFLDLLPSIKDVTIAIDCFANSHGKTPRIGDLIALTNKVQSDLLCLGQPHAIEYSSSSSPSSTFDNSPVSTLDVSRNTSSYPRSHSLSSNPNTPPLPQPPAKSSSFSSSYSSLKPSSLFPPAPKTNPSQAQHALQILRLAALIYSDFIIFPLAFASGIRFKLAKRMCGLLQMRPALGHVWQSGDNRETQHGLDYGGYLLKDARLEMWILTMGCVACLPYYTGTRTGGWLGGRLRAVLGDVLCCADENGGRTRNSSTKIVVGSAPGQRGDRAGRETTSEFYYDSDNDDDDDDNDGERGTAEYQDPGGAGDTANYHTRPEEGITTQLPPFETFIVTMQGFCWWRPVCDEYARDLWRTLYDTTKY